MKIIYVTGCLGFIPSYFTRKALEKGWKVFGVDKVTYAADETLLEEGMIFAIEPFATLGTGRVKEGGKETLYTQIAKKPVRSPAERKVLQQLEQFHNMPFVNRWITGVPALQLKVALKNFVRLGILIKHPPLVDTDIVAQAEHSVKVTKDGGDVLTK